MAAVIRVKRRVDEEPLNAFVLNCKRRKVSQENASEAGASSSNNEHTKEETCTILKFAGTVETQDEGLASRITKMSMEEAKERIGKTRLPQPVARARDTQRQKAHEERFKIVNCSRAVDASCSGDEKAVTILDIEKQAAALPNSEAVAAAQTNPTSIDPKGAEEMVISSYVYDLYVSELGDLGHDIDDGMLEHQLSVRPFDDLIYGSHRDNGLAGQDSDEDDESDDSNDENNWRNDYPDSDPDSSIDERDMRRAVEKFNLDTDDLSTDDDDYEYNDSGHTERDEYWQDCDDSDDSIKGRDYERYHRMLRLMEQSGRDE
ncbi:probable RNA polymerase II nuclear localization protein SLC7A6OS [Lutzomyia longipalpis]|uniref:probable RNA polymerase II nuclear localization protein SLC7A6OS n=1 Tax=Lutzomyia longipalpis TaxID=7200 RepID=UPI0024844EC1|nr:probable RNA polymerase II nuclear localization protein SLC7A6OS [Lutzomyia longipalpis]